MRVSRVARRDVVRQHLGALRDEQDVVEGQPLTGEAPVELDQPLQLDAP